jgi:hypothetical protein
MVRESIIGAMEYWRRVWGVEPREVSMFARLSTRFGGRVEQADVPIVTCERCEHCFLESVSGGEIRVCEYGNGLYNHNARKATVSAHDFCSWGEGR